MKQRSGLELDREQLLVSYAAAEARAELDHPSERYPDILARSFRSLGEQLGVPVTQADATALATSVPDWLAFADSSDIAQSLFHDHVPAKRMGLRTVWINRRHDRPGWGASPAPPGDVVPDWEFPSMAAFASAGEGE